MSSDKREKYYPIQNTYLYTIHVSLKIAVVKCSSAVSLYDIVYSSHHERSLIFATRKCSVELVGGENWFSQFRKISSDFFLSRETVTKECCLYFLFYEMFAKYVLFVSLLEQCNS